MIYGNIYLLVNGGLHCDWSPEVGHSTSELEGDCTVYTHSSNLTNWVDSGKVH